MTKWSDFIEKMTPLIIRLIMYSIRILLSNDYEILKYTDKAENKFLKNQKKMQLTWFLLSILGFCILGANIPCAEQWSTNIQVQIS